MDQFPVENYRWGKSDQGFDQSLENANLPSGVLAFTFLENRVVNRLKTGGLLGYF